MTEHARFRRGPLIGVVVCLLIAIAAFLCGPGQSLFSERPDELRMGTASRGGAYAKLGIAFAPLLEASLPGTRVHALHTPGSIHNVDQITAGAMDLALIQSDSPHSDRVQVVEALFPEFLHIVVRTKAVPNARSIRDLDGKVLAIGPKGSGTRKLVKELLDFFEVKYTAIDVKSVSEEGLAMREGRVDAMCRVAGRPDAIVGELLELEGMALVPLVTEEERIPDGPVNGFQVDHRGYTERSIEARTYPGQKQAVPTLAVTAILVASAELPPDVVTTICRTLHDHREDMRRNPAVAPYLKDHLSVDDVDSTFAVHAGSRAFHDGPTWWSWGGWVVFGLALLGALGIGLREVLGEPVRARRARRARRLAQGPDGIGASDVFISYSTQGRHALRAVKKIAHHLESRDLRCWYAPRDIPGGEAWAQHIPVAIERCRRALVVVVTKEVQTSEHIERELTLASDRRLAIMPVRIEPVIPEGTTKYFLSNVQWIDAMPSVQKHHLETLRACVERVTVHEPGSSEVRPPDPEPEEDVPPGDDAPVPPPPDPVPSRRLARVALVVSAVALTLALWRPWASPPPPPAPTLPRGPDIEAPANNSSRLGGLFYKWSFERHGPGVRYDIERRAGDKILVKRGVRDRAKRERSLNGTITFRVRAHVPDADGTLRETAWSDARVVESYRDSLDKIVAKRVVVIAISDEVTEDPAQDPELFVIRRALEDHLATVDPKARLTLETGSRPWREMPTLMQLHSHDVMAARISKTAEREGPGGWGVVFTEPVLVYRQAFVHLPETPIRVGHMGEGVCRIAVKAGTQNEKLAHELAKTNPQAKVFPSHEELLVYQQMYDQLRERKVDLLLMDEPFAMQVQREAASLTPVAVTLVDERIMDDAPLEQICIATRPKDDRLRSLINAAIARYRAEIDERASKLRASKPFLKPDAEKK